MSGNHSIPAVAYYRMSSDQQDHSIADQRSAVEEYAAENGYRIIREYLDHAVSGWKIKERVGFQQLIADASERGDFRAVLCFDQDRFSRFDPLEANHYWFLLSQENVHLATVAQGRIDWHSLAGWLTASLSQHGKAEYCRDLARNVTRGLKRRKLAGDWIGGVPFGYRMEGKRLAIGDPDAVAIVRRIFALKIQGHGFFAIARTLNGEGIPSPTGKAWGSQAVRHIVIRRTYVGDSIVGEYSRGKYERIATEQTTIANTHDAIIDRETWQAAQTIGGSYRASGRKGEGAALAGLVKCGRCGGPMYARTNRGCESYLCGNYSHRGECGCCQVPRGPLLAAIASKLREVVLLGSPDRLESAIQRELDRRKTAPVDDGSTRRRIAALDRRIARGANRLLAVDDSIIDDVERELVGLKAERAKLAESIVAKPAGPQRSAKQIAEQIWELDRILATASPAAVRQALARLVDHVRLDFQETAPNGRGKRYAFTGGTIQLRSASCKQLGTWWR